MVTAKFSETDADSKSAGADATKGKRLIPREVVKDRLGNISDATMWRMSKRGELPKPVKLSSGRVMWIESEIDALIEAGAAARVA